MAYDSTMILMEYMEWCHVGFERTESTLVLVAVTLLGLRCTMTPSRLHTHLLCNHNGNDTWSCRWLIDWIYATVSCWRWTNSQYVGIRACLNLNVSLLGIRCTMTPSQLHTRLLFNYNDIRTCADVNWIWNGIVLALDEQEVRWYWCIFEFECLIALYTVHHNIIAIAYSRAIQLQWYTVLCWC